MSVLDIAGLDVGYELPSGTIHAVRDLSLALAPGERLGLVGESGSGKTTTALAVMGLLRPPGRVLAGSIRLDGGELVGLADTAHAALRLARVAYVPQGAMNALNPVLRVRQSMAHAMRDHGVALGGVGMAARIGELLAQVGLAATVADRYPHELSGGMKQRVCIAIAISLGPRLIIADEPTSALDVVTQRQVMRTLRAVQDALGSAMILIGHDMGLMAQCVDRVAVMREGRLVEEGPVRRVFGAPAHPYTAELIRSVPVIGQDRRAAPAPAGPVAAPLLEFAGVEKSYGGGVFARPVTALHAFNLTVPDTPRIVSIVGQSGSGKSTIGGLALGLLAPSAGVIRWRGVDLGSLGGAARRDFRRQVQAVFQDPYSTFNPFYRVAHALTVPLYRFGLARNRDEARGKAEAAVRAVGLDPGTVLERFAHQLSGGQRQRLMVARALMLRPRLLVADEPVSMVDASLRAAILDLLVELRDGHGISVLYITHDLATAWRVGDEVLVLHRGRVVEAGDPDIVLRQPTHDYTRVLLDSLPVPDPGHPWGSPAGDALAAELGMT